MEGDPRPPLEPPMAIKAMGRGWAAEGTPPHTLLLPCPCSCSCESCSSKRKLPPPHIFASSPG